MTDQSRLQLTDALIEKMLAQRAGPGAPADLVPAIAAAIDSTGQRAPGVLGTLWGPAGSRTRRGPGRTWLLAAAALLLVGGAMAAGSGLVKLPSVVPPVPAPTLPVAVASPTAGPTISPSPSPVATSRPAAVIAYVNYVSKGIAISETGRVWIVGTDGTGAHELFPGVPGGIAKSGEQTGVAWSPDGSRLIYEVYGRLYLTDASGSEPQPLDPGCVPPACWDGSAAFSPDGTQLVLVRVHGDVAVSGSIATMDLASGRVVELSSTSLAGPERPRWSADGKQIVFSRMDKMRNGSAVFIVDADGQNLRQLSSSNLPARLPDWSPDGSRIVFTSLVNKDIRVGGDNVADVYQDVYTVRPDWTDLRRLTTDGFSSAATWTPDGRIMFTRGCTVKRPTGSSGESDCSAAGLWTMDAHGGNAQLLVPVGVQGFFEGIDAAWQPTP